MSNTSLLCLIVCLIIIWLGRKYVLNTPNYEQFTQVPKSFASAHITDYNNFRSPKSNIISFNEVTEPSQWGDEFVEPNNPIETKQLLSQPKPELIYTYTYFNRYFDTILINVIHDLDKQYNNRRSLLDKRANLQWLNIYQQQFQPIIKQFQKSQNKNNLNLNLNLNPNVQIYKFSNCEVIVQHIILRVMDAINAKFNMSPNPVNFDKFPILVTSPSDETRVLHLYVNKAYTANGDVVYEPDALNPNLNEHLSENFKTPILIFADNINIDRLTFTLKFLRIPILDYQQLRQYSTLEDLPAINVNDTSLQQSMFYLTQSGNDLDGELKELDEGSRKDRGYQLYTNQDARQIYMDKLRYNDPKRQQFKCFPKYTKGIKDVGLANDQLLCKTSNGIWEQKCQQDDDCPYYQSNKNYTNTFGGCNKSTGYCQLPKGIKHLTYRQADKSTIKDALCYNCKLKGSSLAVLGKCCTNQSQPDFQFDMDIDQRRLHQQQLSSKGLSWSKYGN